MKKFWLRVILYTGYLSLGSWIVIGLPVLFVILIFAYPSPNPDEFTPIINSVSQFIIDVIYFTSIYLLIVASSVRGIMSTKKILRGEIPSKIDILCIILLIIAGILFLVWMSMPFV